MAKQEIVQNLSIEASTDLSSHQFKLVKVDSNGQLVLLAASTDVAVGVLQDDPAAQGRPGQVAVFGRVKVIAGGTVASGGLVMGNSSGLAIAATGAGNRVVGLCLKGGAVNELIEVLLFPVGYPLAA